MRSSTEIKDPRNDIPDYFPESKFDHSNNLSPNHARKSENFDKQETFVESKASPQKHEMLSFIYEAYGLIKENLDDHEKRGLYLFHVMRCRHKDQD